MLAIELEDRRDRSRGGSGPGSLHRPTGESQQVVEGGTDVPRGGRRRGGATAGRQMVEEERAEGCPGEVLGGQVFRGEPGAEVLDGSDILLDDGRGMTTGIEVSDVVREPVPQEIGPDAVAD